MTHVTNSLSQIIIQHSNYSHYGVFVGRHEPDCKTSWASVDACCWQHMWRVSTDIQMAYNALTACGQTNHSLDFAKIDHDKIAINIHHRDLEHISTCTTARSNGQDVRVCDFVISIVNVYTFNVASRHIRLKLFETDSMMIESSQQYIPLKFIYVQVLPLFREADEVVYAVNVDLQTESSLMNSFEMIVPSFTKINNFQSYILQREECARFAPSNTSLHGLSYPLTQAEALHTQTFWKAPAGLNYHMFRAFFILQPQNSLNSMKIAASHNVSLASMACQSKPKRLHLDAASLLVAQGIGQDAVNNMVAFPSNASTSGFGNLFSFIAISKNPSDTAIEFANIFIVYTTDHAWIEPLLPTVMANNSADFSFEFRAACLENHDKCAYEYALSNPFASNHQLVNCGARETAKNWLKNSFRVFDDYGHIDALCARMQSVEPIKSACMLVHTQQYFYASRFAHQNVRSYIWVKPRVS